MNFIYNAFLEVQKGDNNINTQNNSWSSTINIFGQLFTLILVFVVIIALTYYVTRLIATTKYKTKNSNLKIIDSISVGYQSIIQIIEAGNKTILIGVTKERISFICELDKDSISKDINASKLEASNLFQKYYNNFLNKKHDEDIKK